MTNNKLAINDTLLPCPFCGHKATFVDTTHWINSKKKYRETFTDTLSADTASLLLLFAERANTSRWTELEKSGTNALTARRTQMTLTLKPCPFCGNNVYIEEKTHGYYGYYINRYEYDIHCHNCGCSIYLERNDTINRSDEEAKVNTIKAWNRRANENENKGGDNP